MICAALVKVESSKSLSPRVALCSGYVNPCCCCFMQQELRKINIVWKKRLGVALSLRHICDLCERTHDNNKKQWEKKYIDVQIDRKKKEEKKMPLVCKDLIRRVCQSAFWKKGGKCFKNGHNLDIKCLSVHK